MAISVRKKILLGALAATFSSLTQAAPSLFFDTINGSTQLAGIEDLSIAGGLYDVRWYSTQNYYDTFSLANPLSPTFMNDFAGGAAAANAIADFLNSVPSLPRSTGFQSFRPNDGTSALISLRAIGMIPTSYTFNTQYQRWEANGPSLQLDALPVLDAAGSVDSSLYAIKALVGGFGAITNETGPGGRGIIDAYAGWAFVSFTDDLAGTPTTPLTSTGVPEPGSAALLVAGLSALGLGRRRRITRAA